ncbi:unnamed protein product [Rhizoctonia solani]|uniref:WW domain-containing protein n=1 Tax=Rhizoctonia solani TaxID=456999 RepID=A0A8H2Y293_9AGAM|nr:unnamed protein product [Rhizoctonia solani]
MNPVGDMLKVAIEPAPFIDNPRLWEGLPSQTNRYDDVFAGPRAARTMMPGSQSALTNVDGDSRSQLLPVPEGWVEFIHPEGRPYYYNSELRVVTETYLRHPNQLAFIEEWYSVFRQLRNRVLPSASNLDVFLDCDGRNTCRYYMIDHANKTICWLRQRQTSDIGIADVRSVLGLRALLFEEYWTHLEYVPKNENHLGAVRSELQGTLASCLVDHMTSEGSTSPFTKTECKSYLFSLNQAAESGHMLYLNWSIARIMGLLVHSRNVNLYGQYGARLDRTATVEGRRHPPRSEGYMYKSVLLGGGPVIHLNRLENLWVDRIIYTHHWRGLINDLTEEWSTAVAGAGVMWASNVVFVASPSVDIITKTACGISAIAAGATGIFTLHMIREHRSLGKYAAHAANYFQLYENHATGLQGLSIKYSIPWAGVMWSFGITCVTLVFYLLSSFLVLAGAHLHVLVTAFLVVSAYVYARGVNPFLHDIRKVAHRIGLINAPPPPTTPVARSFPANSAENRLDPVDEIVLPPPAYDAGRD